jgi:fumarate reductase subunit D
MLDRIVKWAGWAASAASWAALLGPFAPIVTGVAQAVGAVVTAIGEIVVALAKSPEGRVVLALGALGIAFLYGRFHYIEQGRAAERIVTAAKVQQALAVQRKGFKCPSPAGKRW